jgi:hypothetical protein
VDDSGDDCWMNGGVIVGSTAGVFGPKMGGGGFQCGGG